MRSFNAEFSCELALICEVNLIAKSCLVCGKVTNSARCESHKPKHQSRQSRGYNAAYDAARRRLAAAVAADLAAGRGVPCVICGRAILSLAHFSAEHVTPLRAGGG